MTSTLKKIELRAALVDRSGDVLFYTILDESNVRQSEPPRQSEVLKGSPDPAPKGSPDIRDPKHAKRYIRALLTEYRREVAQ